MYLVHRYLLSLTAIACSSSAVQAATGEPALTGTFESLRDAGEKAYAANNYGLAERNYLAAIKSAESQSFSPADSRWAQIYKDLSALYEVRGNFQKNEFYLEKELRAREKQMGAENPQVLALVGRLCRAYLLHNNQAKADRLSKLLLNYGERIQREESQIDAHFAELHKFFSTHNEYSEAEKKLKTAKETAQKVRADDHLELAASLDGIAAAYKEKGNLALAEQMYKRALDLREKTLVPGHMALAFGYENLANLYALQGKTAQAKPLFEQSLEITKKTLDVKRPEVFSRLDNVAHNYISLGQYSQAESLYKQAIDLIKENGGTKSRDFGQASSSLASLYMKQGRYAEAAPLLKTAVAVNESIYGPQSATLGPLLDSYAESLEKSNNSSEAAKIRQRASSIRGTTSACKESSGNSSREF